MNDVKLTFTLGGEQQAPAFFSNIRDAQAAAEKAFPEGDWNWDESESFIFTCDLRVRGLEIHAEVKPVDPFAYALDHRPI